MEIVLTLVRQVLMMFLLVGIGYALFRAGKVTAEGSKTLGSILVTVSLPAVIINSFMIERTPEHVRGLLFSAVAAAANTAAARTVGRLKSRKVERLKS